jgi:hypothetical protein
MKDGLKNGWNDFNFGTFLLNCDLFDVWNQQRLQFHAFDFIE